MLRKFLADVSTYTLATLLSRSVGLLLLPVYTRFLTPADYGIVELLAVAFALLNLTLPLEISQAVARFVPDAKSAEEKTAYASAAFWFTAGVFAAFAGLVFAAPGPAARLLLGSESHTFIVRFGAVAMIAGALFYVVQNQLRWTLQPRAVAGVSLLNALLSSLVSATLIVGFDAGAAGFIGGQLTGNLAALWAGLKVGRLPPEPALRGGPLKEMLSFSAPLVLSGLAVYATTYTDRWMLRALLGLDEVGIYSAAFRVASVLNLAVVGIQMSLMPIVYHSHREPGTPPFIGRVFGYYLLCALPLIALLGGFDAEIVRLLTGPEFHEAAPLVVWLALAYVAMNAYIFAPGMSLARKTGRIALVNIAVACVNVLLNLVWIPRFGVQGAALATLTAGLTMATLYFAWSAREYPVPYPLGRAVAALSLFSLYLGAVQAIPIPWLARLAIWALFSLLIARILLDASDRRLLRDRLFSRSG
jgi:O-antigen/teichoic acid export membrane protein